MSRRWTSVAVVVVVLAPLLVWRYEVNVREIARRNAELRDEFFPIKEGVAAPDFEATDQDGRLFRLSDYRGKVVLLEFWAFW